jgi:hypothetical protein
MSSLRVRWPSPMSIRCPERCPSMVLRTSFPHLPRRHVVLAKRASVSLRFTPLTEIAVGPGYQTPFAEQIRREANILTGAVGMIGPPVQAEHILATEQADAVIIAREFLRDPYWPLRAAHELGQPTSWPVQYLRAAPEGSQARVPAYLRSVESCFEEHTLARCKTTPR